MIAALRLPRFRTLFAALVISMIGDSAMMLVPAVAMKDLTGSAGAAGLTLLFFMAPVCAAPAFGWVVDRFRRRTVLVVTCLLSAVALTPLLVVDAARDRWILYAVTAAMGASYVCVFGSVTALVRELVPEHLLAGANSAVQTVRQGLRLGGPLLGAALYTLAGIGAVALLNLASFLVAALMFGLLRVREAAPARPRFAWWPELTAGLRAVAARAPVRRSAVVICALFVAGGVTESAVFAVIAALGRPPAFLGVLATTTGIGAVVGGLAAARLISRHGELGTLAAGAAVYGTATIALSVPALPAVLAAAAGTGIGITLPFIARVTLLQRSTPAALTGRATTAYDAIGGVTQVASIAAGAALVGAVSHRILLPAAGLLALAAAAYAWRVRSTPMSENIEDRTARVAGALGAAGWRAAGPAPGPHVTTLAAFEKGGWRCEHVRTDLPDLPEALRVVVTSPGPGRSAEPYVDGDDDRRFLEQFGVPVDVLVDVRASRVTSILKTERATGRRLDAALTLLAAVGDLPTDREPGILSGLGLIGGLLTVTDDGATPRDVSGFDLPTRDVRPIDDLRPELDADPNRATLWLEAGLSAAAHGWWPTAVAAFERAADCDDDPAEAGFAALLVGRQLYHAEPEPARAALRRAAEAGSHPAQARDLERRLLHFDGDHEAAVAAMAQGVEAEPYDPEVWSDYGLDLAHLGRAADAVAALDVAIELEDTPDRRWYRGFAHLRAGDRTAALDDLEAAADELGSEIYADPDLASLRDEPRFMNLRR